MSVVQNVLESIKYPPVKFLETRLFPAAAPLPVTSLTTYSQIQPIEPWLVWLRDISFGAAGARNANVNAIIRGQVAEKRYEDIIAFGAAMPEIFDKLPLNVPFDFNAQVILANAAAAVNNYQGRVTWEVQNYSVADKLALGIPYTSLDEYEQGLADKYHIMRNIRGGKLPMKYPKGDLQYEIAGNFSGALAANTELNLLLRAVPDGYKCVLTKLWASREGVVIGDVELRVYQERQLRHTMFPYCFPDYTTAAPTRRVMPVDVWIPAISEMRATIISTSGHAAPNIAMAEAEMRRLTIWDKMAWNLEKKRQITTGEERDMISELNLREKLDAGIYELVTPLPTSALLGSE